MRRLDPIGCCLVLLAIILPGAGGCRTCGDIGGVDPPALPIRTPELVVDVRDYDYRPLEGASVRLISRRRDGGELPVTMVEHWGYVASIPTPGGYLLEVAHPGRQTELRRFETTGGRMYERFVLIPAGEPAYYLGGERRPTEVQGPLQVIIKEGKYHQNLPAEAARLGLHVVDFPAAFREEEHLLLRFRPSGDWQELSSAMRELRRRTRVVPHLVVQNCPGRLLALSNRLTVIFATSPMLPEVRSALDSAGFDPSTLSDAGSGIWRISYRGVPDIEFLEAVDALARSPFVIQVENDYLGLSYTDID